VSLEGANITRGQIRAITSPGIAVMGPYRNWLPQHCEEGGYHLKAKTDAENSFLPMKLRRFEEAGGMCRVVGMFDRWGW